MGNPYGRSTIVPLTNKSGGSVAAGDLVYIDTANNDAFTTGTTSGYTKGIGIAQATIASNAIGLVLIDGYAPLVNVNASVTRGNFLKGYTVVKQGTDAGSSRAAGTCGMFLTGGTTPDAIIWQPDLGAGSGEVVATSAIWTTSGKIAVATGTGTATEQWPIGRELDYVEKTTATSVTHQSEATADIVVTSNATVFDGTRCCFEFYAPNITTPNGGPNAYTQIHLFDNTASTSASIGVMANVFFNPQPTTGQVPCFARRFLTPAAGTRTFSVRAMNSTGTSSVTGGAGGTGAFMPAYLRITKA